MWTLLSGLIGIPRLIGLLGIGAVAFFVWGNVQSVIDRYTDMSGKIATLERNNKLLTSRLDSYNLRISRRDEAIAASQCKEKIQYWLRHPDEIPKPFDPFGQLR